MDSRRFAVGVGVVVILATFGCGGPKEASVETGDETKSAARDMTPGTLVDDKVSKSEDPVDWRRFTVEEQTPATLNIYWDNPKVGAKVGIRDMFGGTVAELVHASGAEKDGLANVTLKEGTYFVEVACTSGASVYTLELFLGSATGGSFGIPRPE